MSEQIFFAKKFLKKIRRFVALEEMKTERLPKWVTSAKVSFSKLNNSNIFFFVDSTDKRDSFANYGKIKSDIQFFLDLKEYTPTGFSLKAPQGSGLLILSGEYDQEKKTDFDIKSSNSALFNAGYIPYHSPLAIINIFINLKNRENELTATRFIPFAIYVHDNDLIDFEQFWRKCTPHIQETLLAFQYSEIGDYYQSLTKLITSVLLNKEKSVLVFGKDSDPELLNELLLVKNYLKTKNYDAYLLKELDEHPSMSNERKMKHSALSSRFCVMIDRSPSGHIAEYICIKSVEEILAFLRPKGKGSTWMIGDASLTDINYIKLFEFENSPLEVLDFAIAWAEDFMKKRIKEYNHRYPWR